VGSEQVLGQPQGLCPQGLEVQIGRLHGPAYVRVSFATLFFSLPPHPPGYFPEDWRVTFPRFSP